MERKDRKGRKAFNHYSTSSQIQDQTVERVPRIIKNDDFVWALPGLDKKVFYAAAEFLRKQEKNQGLMPGNSQQATTNLRTERIQCETLDYVALLFARVKSRSSPQHVTATALQQYPGALEIWIAKNDGPKGEDERFRSDLESWFNRKGVWHKKPEQMAPEMACFWKERINHYVDDPKKGIRALWRELCKGPDSDTVAEDVSAVGGNDEWKLEFSESEHQQPGLVQSYLAIAKVFREEMADAKSFKADWRAAETLCCDAKSLQNLHVTAARGEAIGAIGIERQSYAVMSTLEQLKVSAEYAMLARTFSKLLKAIRLLGTVPRAVESFARFREQYAGDAHIKLEFMIPPDGLELELSDTERKDIGDKLRNWANIAKSQDIRTRMQRTADDLCEQHSFHRFFHCELQVLNKFLDDTRVYDYIGCSKLSCFICWGVLQGTRFRTRDTHANLWRACAFPFDQPKEPSESRYRIFVALKRVQDRMVEKMLRQTLHPDLASADIVSVAETEPEGELKHRRKVRTWWQTSYDGAWYGRRIVHMTRTRAIRIPVDGEPMLEPVVFMLQDWLQWVGPEVRWVPEVWARSLASSQRSTLMEAYTEQHGATRTTIKICGKHYTPEQLITNGPDSQTNINAWHKRLVTNFVDESTYLSEIDLQYRGDMYVSRSVTRGFGDPSALEPIEPEEVSELIQKCRDALAEYWEPWVAE